ncbi:MAG: crossover junction endodeoxyribonuclease RuvC [Thiotrichales bacterium]
MAVIRIIGIDPGSRLTGYGVIDSDGRSSHHIASGAISVVADSFPERLGVIFREVGEILQVHRPEVMAIEKVFVSRSADSALKLGQARGAAICAGVTLALPIAEYSPRGIKQAVVGNGGADKAQVQHMVKMLLGLSGKLQADAADALAIALCHAHTRPLNHLLASQGLR